MAEQKYSQGWCGDPDFADCSNFLLLVLLKTERGSDLVIAEDYFTRQKNQTELGHVLIAQLHSLPQGAGPRGSPDIAI